MKSKEKIDRLCYDYASTIMEGKPDGNLLRQVSDQAKAYASLVEFIEGREPPNESDLPFVGPLAIAFRDGAKDSFDLIKTFIKENQ